MKTETNISPAPVRRLGDLSNPLVSGRAGESLGDLMVIIPLTRGYVAYVDDEDAGLAAFKWIRAERQLEQIYAALRAAGRRP